MKNLIDEIMKKDEYKIGDIVYVKPIDYHGLLKGVIIDFQVVNKKLPIVEFENPYKKGEKFKSAFAFELISKNKTLTIAEWTLVNVNYKYEE